MRSGGGRVDIDSEQKFAWEWYVNESPVENPMVKSPNLNLNNFFLRAGAQAGSDKSSFEKNKNQSIQKKK